MNEIPKLSDAAAKLLARIGNKWPDAMLVAPETEDLMTLRNLDYVEQWDMYPNGDRNWMITPAGREASSRPSPTMESTVLRDAFLREVATRLNLQGEWAEIKMTFSVLPDGTVRVDESSLDKV